MKHLFRYLQPKTERANRSVGKLNETSPQKATYNYSLILCSSLACSYKPRLISTRRRSIFKR